MQKVKPKKDWSFDPPAFRNLLEWLDDGVDSGGQKYLEMRARLVAFFDRKNCLTPDELADETLTRVARRLVEEGNRIVTETPAKYCYITARFVFLEYLRTIPQVPIDDVLRSNEHRGFPADEQLEEKSLHEKMLDCLEKCTEKLEPVNRSLIIRYYYGEERIKIDNRRTLAEELGVSVNALAIRACRIRDKLEACVGKCADA